jgi:hypothetical protein
MYAMESLELGRDEAYLTLNHVADVTKLTKPGALYVCVAATPYTNRLFRCLAAQENAGIMRKWHVQRILRYLDACIHTH